MPTHLDYFAIFKESFTLVILFFCSILSISFAIERWLYFRKALIEVDPLLAGVRKFLEAGKADQAQAACQKNPSPIAQVVYYGLLNREHSRSDLEELLATKRLEERLKLERNLGILGTMGNTAPFIGPFGPVGGILKALLDLASSGVRARPWCQGHREALVVKAAGWRSPSRRSSSTTISCAGEDDLGVHGGGVSAPPRRDGGQVAWAENSRKTMSRSPASTSRRSST